MTRIIMITNEIHEEFLKTLKKEVSRSHTKGSIHCSFEDSILHFHEYLSEEEVEIDLENSSQELIIFNDDEGLYYYFTFIDGEISNIKMNCTVNGNTSFENPRL